MVSRFSWRDPLRVFSLLSSHEAAVHEAAESFANTTLRPRLTQDTHAKEVDRTVMQRMGRMGFLGAKTLGLTSNNGYGAICHAIEAVDSSYRSALSVQSSLVMHPLHTFGTTAQQQTYMDGLADGDLIGCFGLTEPNVGSNAGQLQTTYDDQYKLTGTKTWITNAPVADLGIIWATGDDGIRGFLMPMDQEKVEVHDIPYKMALRASATGTVFMNGAEAEPLPQARGLGAALSCLNQARFGISWGALGAAQDVLGTTLTYASERQVFGGALESKQLVQTAFADMVSNMAFALHGCARVGAMEDVPHELISMVKRNSCHTALDIARRCRDVLGGNGISEEYDVIRHMVNLEAVKTYEGTHDIHGLILGKSITGVAAF